MIEEENVEPNSNKVINEQEPNWDLIKGMSEAPDNQLDKIVCEHLKTLLDKPKEEVVRGLMYILDCCVYGSLASGFVINILNMEFTRLGSDTKNREEYIKLMSPECQNFYKETRS